MARTKQREMDKEEANLMKLEKQEKSKNDQIPKGEEEEEQRKMKRKVSHVGRVQQRGCANPKSECDKIVFFWRDDRHQC